MSHLNLNGWISIAKPLGLSSAQVCSRIKWRTRGAKVGHAGTLDPLASGVLPIALGRATKTVPFLMDATKVYRFTVTFGESRTTDDAAGEVVATSAYRPSEQEIEAALPEFIGEILQTPPAYSAIKIAGQPAYHRARKGEDLKMAPRRVKIIDFRLLSMQSESEAHFEVVCGKGTYVRSLGRDLAHRLGTQGYISFLERTRVGPFELSASWTLDALMALESLPLLPIKHVLVDIPACSIEGAEVDRLARGLPLEVPAHRIMPAASSDETVACIEVGGDLVALARYESRVGVGVLHPIRVVYQ